MQLNINSDGVVKWTAKLEKLHRSALPVAIREALNSAAFNTKQKTMPDEAEKSFVNRSKNFFKANSRVEKATGFNVRQMKSTAGFISTNLKGGNNYAVKDLEQQENGGNIERKSFVPLKEARQGNSMKKLVKSNARLSNINKIVDVRKISTRNKRKAFRLAAIEAGKGGFVLSGKKLWKINLVKRNNKINKTALYNFKKGRSINVKPTNFMKKASIESTLQLENYYIREAQKQIKRLAK